MTCSVLAGVIDGHDLVNISERADEVTGLARGRVRWGRWAIVAGAVSASAASPSALGDDRATAVPPPLPPPPPAR